MKLIDLPDYAKKYKTKGYDVKKINNEFYLYKVDHKRVDDKPYPVTSLTYIGKIDKDLGLIKAYTQKDVVIDYLEYGLSYYLFKNYKRAIQRTLFNLTGDFAINIIKLGIILFIFDEISFESLSSSYLTYKDTAFLLDFYNSNNQYSGRVLRVKTKIEELLKTVFYDDKDRKCLIFSLRNMNVCVSDKNEKINSIPSLKAKQIFYKYGVKYE